MQFDLKYGRQTVSVNIPKKNLLGVLQPKNLPGIKNPEIAFEKALRDPIGSPPLARVVQPNDKVVIIVSDKSRTTFAHIFLPVLIRELNLSGIPDHDISIIFSTGIHPLHTPQEQAKITGPEIAKRISLFDHNSEDESNLVEIGKTSRNTPVKINKKALEADKIILTGSISYHYFAGYSGGRKSIIPGVAGFETIQKNHALCLSPAAGTGKLKGNPVHEDMLETTRMVNPRFLLNVVLNDKKEIAGIFAGDWQAAFRRGCQFLDKYYKLEIKRKADAIIVSAGGYPNDLNFVQSHKALEHASYALKDGGTMIFLAESAEGFPSQKYLEWFSLKEPEKITEKLLKNYAVAGQTVLACIRKAKRFKIIWVSKFMKQFEEKMGIKVVETLDAALQSIDQGSIFYIMPEGYMTFPYLTN